MKKLLYIGDNPKKTSNGGDWVNKRNILALQELYSNRFYIYPIKCRNSIITFINLLNYYMLGGSSRTAKNIIKYVEKNNITSIFLSSSKLGKLAYILKKKFPNIHIYTFFHNIEKQYTAEEYRVNPNFKNWIVRQVTKYNESLACKYADKLIVLNERDNSLLNQIYGLNADILLPTTFIDKFQPELKKTKTSINSQFTLLFVGFAFFANIEGIKWFIENVFPELQNCKLQIVGNGMDKIFTSTSNIEVHGYVEDLAQFYYQADAVILPIFSGGGMKTKTAEALMYGCPIIGTKEAFEGYKLDFCKIGGMANTKEDMIISINKLKENPILIKEASNYARTIFKQSYSIQTTIEILKENLFLS